MNESRSHAAVGRQTLSVPDRVLAAADNALRTLFAGRPEATRPSPAGDLARTELDDDERDISTRLMRINQAGEVAAQGLYQGHALVARNAGLEAKLRHAADEEMDHLAWCTERLGELGSRPSLLNPVWYGGAYLIGAASGLAGDRWGLGFIEETERQVVEHIEAHLQRLPEGDARSRAILERMRDEEAEHGADARQSGAAKLPRPIRALMKRTAEIMKRGAARI
jgi:ubiquinone biosynthesis monooxygenase Coq7